MSPEPGSDPQRAVGRVGGVKSYAFTMTTSATSYVKLMWEGTVKRRASRGGERRSAHWLFAAE